MSTKKNDILFVEDNPFNRMLIIKQLELLGLACDTANNGKQGLDLSLTNQYKLILTDCNMPIMNGYELSQQLRRYENEGKIAPLKIIAVTGESEESDIKQRCLDSGMDTFITKPVKLNVLKQLLSDWYV